MRVFVSHSGRDRAWAEWAAWQLERAGWGITVELDAWDWRAGEDFVARMNTALGTCDHMLALFSAAYFEPARWTGEEWTAAVHIAKARPGFLVPVRLDDTPAPPLLAPLLAPALHGLPREQAREVLLAALRPAGRPADEPPVPGSNEEPRLPGVLPPVWGPVPSRNEAFTGRDAMLVGLREDLLGAGRSVVHALRGAGGVGKTQLAAEYAWRFAGDYDAVWWVHADQANRIGEQYAAFAVALRLVDPATQVGPAVATLRAFCRSRGRWLVVLDNARSAADVRDWLLAGPGHVLVTSRDPQWREIATSVPVDVFARDESIALLRRDLPSLGEADADRLAAALGDLPLALAQATGVMIETDMPAAEYLEVLDATPGEVLDAGTPVSYPASLAQAVRVAADRLAAADPVAPQLLTWCAFLAPEPIPTRWLQPTVPGRMAFRRSIGLIGRYGLAKLADDHLTVHRLTQRLLRSDAPDPQRASVDVEQLLASLTPGPTTDPRSWPEWAAVLLHLGILDLAATANERLAWLGCEAAVYLVQHGEPRAAHDLIAPLYAAWRDRLGPDAARTRWAANYLAFALSVLGRSDEAVPLNRDLLAYSRATYGPDNAETLVAANNLAVRLTEIGEYEQARALHEDTLARRRRISGADDPLTLSSAINFAGVMAELGEHEHARELGEDTLTRYRRVLGDDHPETLLAAELVARELFELGEREEARDLGADTLARCRRVLGNDHPQTLAAAHDHACNLSELGERDRARSLAEDTLERARRVLSADHPRARLATELLQELDG